MKIEPKMRNCLRIDYAEIPHNYAEITIDYAVITQRIRRHYAVITKITRTLRIQCAEITQVLRNSITQCITQFITQFHYAINFFTQLNYAEILKITRLRNAGNYAEIHKHYAMGNLLMVPDFLAMLGILP